MARTILETEHLLLRELTQDDFEETCKLLQDAEVMYAYEGPFSREEVQGWMNNQFRRYQTNGFGLWGVVEKSSETLIGQCGITLQGYQNGLVPEIGYLLRREYWHKGYATEAARACKEYAFDVLGFSTVYSIIRDTNLPSQQVALRNGMHRVDQIMKYYKETDMPHIVYKVEKAMDKGRIQLLRHLQCDPGVCAFSTYRYGGVSTGTYASLNCTPYVGDDPQCVLRNQQILAEALPCRPLELVIPWQTHETEVLTIDEAFLFAAPDERHKMLQGIDALVTNQPGICLCISTADCIPVLLYDCIHHAVAAIHAGWRGTVAHIILRTLRKMHELYGTEAENLKAAIGPGISSDAFEVGSEVFDAFTNAGHPVYDISSYDPGKKKGHIDLSRANVIELQNFGVHESCIQLCGLCTYNHSDEFFSARKLGIKSGRILSGIMLNT